MIFPKVETKQGNNAFSIYSNHVPGKSKEVEFQSFFNF